MSEPDELDEDLFADLYGDDNTAKPTEPAPIPENIKSEAIIKTEEPTQSIEQANADGSNAPNGNGQPDLDNEDHVYGENIYGDDSMANGMNSHSFHSIKEEHDEKPITNEHGFSGTVGIKEDGKMFIGGLNWETTDLSLRDYFTQFGEVIECTVMRDGATGRSRGFGFLTFRDPKTVNIVMVKEHYLDGKIIDPKRAIPRDEQERTSKIFVGGVSQDATERDFEGFFSQFGRVVDATLMMDKDTGRPRGFGFVTFEGEAAVDACLMHPLEILGKPIEVKRAQPRGGGRDEEEVRGGGRFQRRGNDRFGRDGGNENQQQQPQMPQGGPMNTMSPQMMAQYWQRMQQYFSLMQQQMSQGIGQGQGMGGNMQMPQGMNPQMMQQMMAMQQNGGGAGGMGMNRGSTGSPHPQSPAPQNMQGMNPQMMQQMQMQQMQQMQQQGQSQGQGGNGSGSFERTMSPNHSQSDEQPPNSNRPGFSAQEQLAFEQRKYEQQAFRGPGPRGGHNNFGGGSPAQSWDGMYDGVPQPGMGPQGGGRGRGNFRHQNNAQHASQSQAPAGAPTGPKNATRPGGNFRGGRGGQRGYHPYARH